MRIKRYHLASAVDAEGLQNEVSKLLAEGWQPYGQIVIADASDGSALRFFQPMVQYEGEIRA